MMSPDWVRFCWFPRVAYTLCFREPLLEGLDFDSKLCGFREFPPFGLWIGGDQ